MDRQTPSYRTVNNQRFTLKQTSSNGKKAESQSTFCLFVHSSFHNPKIVRTQCSIVAFLGFICSIEIVFMCETTFLSVTQFAVQPENVTVFVVTALFCMLYSKYKYSDLQLYNYHNDIDSFNR